MFNHVLNALLQGVATKRWKFENCENWKSENLKLEKFLSLLGILYTDHNFLRSVT